MDDAMVIGKENIAETEKEKGDKTMDKVNKRITLSKNTYKKINIIKMLEDEIVQSMQESDLIGYIIDKAVDVYYKSDAIQSRLQEL